MNTKQAMLKAKQYIKNKQYDKARRILAKVDHPTARKWEAKLDEVAPRRWWTRTGCQVGLGIVFVLFTAWGIAAWRSTQAVTDMTIGFDLGFICQEVYRDDFEDTELEELLYDACFAVTLDWDEGIYEDEIRYCYEQSQQGSLEAQFGRCLGNNDYRFPYPDFDAARATATADAGT